MSLRLQIQWPNAKHPLLANPQVVVLVDNVATEPLSTEPGRWLFEIDEGAAHVLVKVKFVPKLSVKVDGAPLDLEVETLRADQGYLVEGTTLQPDPTPFHLVDGEMIAQNVHPLIDTVSAGNAAAGLTIAEVRTEFVDVTELWFTVANFNHLATWESDCERDIRFVAIASTGSMPPLWFASFPFGLEPPTPEVGTLVFYRPTLQYNYDTPWDPRHSHTWGQFNHNRYLLAPRDPEAPSILWDEAVPRPDDSYWYIESYYPLRASFQQALLRSGKPIVLLQPWPTNHSNFGDAVTAKLPDALKGILRMLRGLGLLGVNHPSITPGRLGIACYSAGGPNGLLAFQTNRHRVRELYLFDPNQLATSAPHIIQWARQTPDFRLRMTGIYSWATIMAIARSVRDNITGEAGDLFLSAYPQSRSFWAPLAKGGSRYWNYVIQKHPEYQHDFNVQHQFVVFGGETIEVDEENRMTGNVTWMEEFLKGSGF